jgi:hypothetical protein
VIALFFILGWDRCVFHIKHPGTHYSELVFLHPVGSVGHVVILVHPGREMSTHYFSCSSGRGAVSIKSSPGHVTWNLCFCIRWDLRVT